MSHEKSSTRTHTHTPDCCNFEKSFSIPGAPSNSTKDQFNSRFSIQNIFNSLICSFISILKLTNWKYAFQQHSKHKAKIEQYFNSKKICNQQQQQKSIFLIENMLCYAFHLLKR